MQSMTVYVEHPERQWLASKSDLAWLTDPDVDDKRIRWSDRDERAWSTIATEVEKIALLLQQGEYEVNDDGDAYAVVDVDTDGLAEEDRELIAEWFSGVGLSPCGDPWVGELVDGRHRLWNAWKAAPHVLLPIHSDLLADQDSSALLPVEFSQTLKRSAASGLQRVPAGVAARNPRFIEQLRQLAQS